MPDTDDAYRLGAAAYKNDRTLSENPFDSGDSRFDEWEDGWSEALDAELLNAGVQAAPLRGVAPGTDS
ncbi:MAG: hypothetical protein KKF85_03550 [Gammaproteobacteria bacterium]|nr:hypothetical protein [Rhodocyclaceae bacterium]MBU3908898.1 hypothetical protein [Gammaproteobacteria bacterium]MBU3987765.1 hypothetical protein [Gammaproteobacteria bacterium]MBU4003376.1 hypothetical protein [Gammaproteobacteria bacterium]MBU4021847.1 hypothetical protein [Gammaproteobacteria bacterium]